MAILSREDFFSKLNERLGSDTSDESIAFLEDMTDTYNDLERRSNGDGVNWEQKYKELDESWKSKYKHRFFSSSDNSYVPPNNGMETEEEDTSDTIQIKDLFK